MNKGGSKLRPFLLGGLIGGAVALAADRLNSRRGPGRHPTPPGLAAFEGAPCFAEAESEVEAPAIEPAAPDLEA